MTPEEDEQLRKVCCPKNEDFPGVAYLSWLCFEGKEKQMEGHKFIATDYQTDNGACFDCIKFVRDDISRKSRIRLARKIKGWRKALRPHNKSAIRHHKAFSGMYEFLKNEIKEKSREIVALKAEIEKLENPSAAKIGLQFIRLLHRGKT